MLKHFTLEYWTDEGWYVGRLKEIPGVFSQGETLEELEDNIRDAYKLMMLEEGEDVIPHDKVQVKELKKRKGRILNNKY
jgi:predicted RNase H-like HicB family nuclease